ncbi:MAG: hypothetical protein KF782_25875 [Labilithrix sp.]|nr:hypothetical protein [Labilithrix sp.]
MTRAARARRGAFPRAVTARRVGLSGAFAAALIASFASCASNEEAGPPLPEAPVTLPEAAPPEDVEAGPIEAGCDAGDPDCVTEVVPCDAVEWCSVPFDVSPFFTLTKVWGSSKTDVWAVGSGGTIIHFDGAKWTATPTGVQNTFFDVWGSGPNDVWAVSSSTVLLHTTGFKGGAAVWENLPTAESEFNSVFIRAIWGTSPTDVRIGGRAFDLPDSPSGTGDQYVLAPSEDGGVAWRPLPGTHTVTSIWGSSAGDVWMTADNSVYVGYQRGMTLHGTPSSAWADAGGVEDPLAWSEVDSQSSLTLESVWGSSSSDVWAVGPLGTIRHITPADARWQKVDAKTTNDLHAVWGSGPNDVWAVGEAGTILHYDGASFEPASAQLPLGKKPSLRGVWGSGPDDVWIVGDGVILHYAGPKSGKGGAK